MRLRHGGLGGVMDFSTFEARLETSTSIEPLVSQCSLKSLSFWCKKEFFKCFYNIEALARSLISLLLKNHIYFPKKSLMKSKVRIVMLVQYTRII